MCFSPELHRIPEPSFGGLKWYFLSNRLSLVLGCGGEAGFHAAAGQALRRRIIKVYQKVNTTGGRMIFFLW